MKFGKIILAAVLMASLTVTAYAESADESFTGSLGSSFSYTHTMPAPDPSYIVTIPSEVELAQDGTEVAIEASDVKDLDGKAISVTIAGTDYYRNQFILEPNTSKPGVSPMRYSITTAKGEELSTSGGKDEHVGKELASFTKDGTVSYTVKPIITEYTQYDVSYSGTITYGISVA